MRKISLVETSGLFITQGKNCSKSRNAPRSKEQSLHTVKTELPQNPSAVWTQDSGKGHSGFSFVLAILQPQQMLRRIFSSACQAIISLTKTQIGLAGRYFCFLYYFFFPRLSDRTSVFLSPPPSTCSSFAERNICILQDAATSSLTQEWALKS